MTAAAQFDGGDPAILGQEPERTSISAILSLVLGLLGCCTAVTAPIGLLLAIVGIIGIARSQGRVGGMGFAVAGLIVSLLSLGLVIGLLIVVRGGFTWLGSNVSEPTAQIFLDIQDDKFDDARAAMNPPGSEASDEAMIAFREAYRSNLGDLVSTPNGIMEYISSYLSFGEHMESLQERNGELLPIPMRFDNGMGMVVLVHAPTAQGPTAQNQQGAPVPIELIVIDGQGDQVVFPPPSGGYGADAADQGEPPASDAADGQDESDPDVPDAPDTPDTDQGDDGGSGP